MFTWRLHTADGNEVSVETEVPEFDNQSDAESWIGEEYPALLDEGVDAVTLLEDGTVVYADMSLHPST